MTNVFSAVTMSFVFSFHQVCLEKMQDLQLALVISRLYESEFETSSTYKHILQSQVLSHDTQAHQDPFLRSMAHWILEDYSRALDTLLEQPSLDPDTGLHVAQWPPGDPSALLFAQFSAKFVLLM